MPPLALCAAPVFTAHTWHVAGEGEETHTGNRVPTSGWKSGACGERLLFTMKVVRTVPALRRALAGSPRPLALVPTMGALHEGHAALMRRARKATGPGGSVAVSIFVNPAQFGPGEDLARYPRSIRADLECCRKAGVDLVFVPRPGAMYAGDHSVWIDETRLSAGLCGAGRPGHFRGVCTVVAKLFLLFQPDSAVFGAKDYQQLAVIRRMVRDLNFSVRIVAVPTVREPDGLALSSRNRYLSPGDRAEAPALRRALLRSAELLRREGPAAAARACRAARSLLGSRWTVEYVEVVDAVTLDRPRTRSRGVVVAAAARLGGTRLIDNVIVR